MLIKVFHRKLVLTDLKNMHITDILIALAHFTTLELLR